MLPAPALHRYIEAKNAVKVIGSRAGKPFENRVLEKGVHGPPLPKLPAGSVYREFSAGGAHPGDSRPAGSWRFVMEILENSMKIAEAYYSDEHYLKGTFIRLAD